MLCAARLHEQVRLRQAEQRVDERVVRLVKLAALLCGMSSACSRPRKEACSKHRLLGCRTRSLDKPMACCDMARPPDRPR